MSDDACGTPLQSPVVSEIAYEDEYGSPLTINHPRTTLSPPAAILNDAVGESAIWDALEPPTTHSKNSPRISASGQNSSTINQRREGSGAGARVKLGIIDPLSTLVGSTGYLHLVEGVRGDRRRSGRSKVGLSADYDMGFAESASPVQQQPQQRRLSGSWMLNELLGSSSSLRRDGTNTRSPSSGGGNTSLGGRRNSAPNPYFGLDPEDGPNSPPLRNSLSQPIMHSISSASYASQKNNSPLLSVKNDSINDYFPIWTSFTEGSDEAGKKKQEQQQQEHSGIKTQNTKKDSKEQRASSEPLAKEPPSKHVVDHSSSPSTMANAPRYDKNENCSCSTTTETTRKKKEEDKEAESSDVEAIKKDLGMSGAGIHSEEASTSLQKQQQRKRQAAVRRQAQERQRCIEEEYKRVKEAVEHEEATRAKREALAFRPTTPINGHGKYYHSQLRLPHRISSSSNTNRKTIGGSVASIHSLPRAPKLELMKAPASILVHLRVFDPKNPRKRSRLRRRSLPNGKRRANWEAPPPQTTFTLSDVLADNEYDDDEEEEINEEVDRVSVSAATHARSLPSINSSSTTSATTTTTMDARLSGMKSTMMAYDELEIARSRQRSPHLDTDPLQDCVVNSGKVSPLRPKSRQSPIISSLNSSLTGSKTRREANLLASQQSSSEGSMHNALQLSPGTLVTFVGLEDYEDYSDAESAQ